MRVPLVAVAVAIVRGPDGRVLMTQRTARQIAPGFWELPGGKIEPGETTAQAAARELEEETGLRAQALRPWMSYEHAFRLRRVRLECWLVERWSGTAHGREGQQIAWIDPAAPAVEPLLPSVHRALDALALPSLYAVCDASGHDGVDEVIACIASGVRAGMRLWQLRAAAFTPDQRVALARRVNAVARPAGARVLLVGSSLEARRADVEGIHSTTEELRRMTVRPATRLWICSCQDRADLERAHALGANAAVLNPVLKTPTHPERPALGWESFESLSRSARLPLYAQGGLDARALHEARARGAIGVATARWHH
jgi:8-oxo-dGTP diphosphatase